MEINAEDLVKLFLALTRQEDRAILRETRAPDGFCLG